MGIIERMLGEVTSIGKTPGEKAINRAMIKEGASNPKDVSKSERRAAIDPLIEASTGPVHIGSNFGRYFFFRDQVGPDVMADLIKEGKIEPGFDYGIKPKDQSLPDFLREEAKKEGWKE